ncbi:glycosyltransferase [Acetatifactor muris]|uniref:Glycosyl transferases group 1 n=1 Tax=Acetatifactor muris TaxID=879566 RepID=A0A2K4ZEK1_9FIRM|nr:glycosyltransferase [Acetatifactor muris]MCR2048501.1 glycosyltransferase [Acetatifactor muris]SOY28893.1 Glycosyl transferases group 1 [Acetatifactor muris]
MGKRVLKLSCNDWKNASHDKRELSAYRELGEEVAVVAKGNIKDKGRSEMVDGFKVFRLTTRPFGNKVPDVVNRIFSLFFWARFVKQLRVDVITAHDIDALFIAWLSLFGILKKNRPALIYDSHEFEIERNVKRNKLQKYVIIHLERFLIKRCNFSIMVNENIAEEVSEIHKLKQKPIVIRNVAERWEIQESDCERIRAEFEQQLGIGGEMGNKPVMLMYHGVLIDGRGIEMLIRLISAREDTVAVILGNAQRQEYYDSLISLTKQLGVEKRILFHEAVSITELWKYVGAVDVGMILAPAVCKNSLYSLPNKFFENIQSETPVICPEYPAMKTLVDKYKIGITCDPGNLADIAIAVSRMKNDREFYLSCKMNLKIAKEELCWNSEKQILKSAYKKYIMGNRK